MTVFSKAELYARLFPILFLCWSTTIVAQDEFMQEVTRLGSDINTDTYDEASPVVSLDGRYLYFTRTGSPDFDRTLMIDGVDVSQELTESAYRKKLSEIYSEIAGKPVRDPYLSPYNQDILIARNVEGVFDTIMHPGPPLNNAFPNSILSAAADTSSLVVMNQFFENGSMHEGFSVVSIDEERNFGFPRPMHIYEFYTLSGDVNLAQNLYGTVMVLSLERKDGMGQNDLHVSFKISDDLWSAPVNIGSDINTEFQESTPFITGDGRHMYFASNRPGSVGGMDIWVSNRLDYTWKKWSKPKRLEEPINSEFDDGQACVDNTGQYMYFASRREGSSDIFRASIVRVPRLSKPIKIKGRIVDGDTGKPIRGELYFGPSELDGYLEYFHTYTGLFEVELYEYELYKFFARKVGYQSAKLMFDARLADMQDLSEHYMVLKLYKARTMEPDSIVVAEPKPAKRSISDQIAALDVGEQLSFYNIYFKQSEAMVLKQSYPALDELAKAMADNPALTIQVEGHTDNVGNEADLMELSWNRAEAIKTYLVQKEIDGERVTTIGYGSQKPVVDNMSEFNRRKNRRVEVRITAKD